jgi:hypothetical protein
VTILFNNKDAFIINKSDFEKLNELGYIGDDLGQFKTEAIFDEACFMGPGKWMGNCDDGSIWVRPRKLVEKYTFEQFKNKVINSSSQV